jgi:hypothetical protein
MQDISSGAEINCDVPTLAELADRIRVSHKAAQTACANALAHSFSAGEALLEARNHVATGWHLWLRENCFLAASTARLYIQIARHRAEIEAKVQKDSLFSLRAARRLIAAKKPPQTSKSNPKPAGLSGLMTDSELTKALASIGWVRFLRVMPAAWHSDLEERLVNLRADKREADLKLRNILCKALSLIKTAGIDHVITEGNKNEAIAALRRFIAILAGRDCNINDITINVTKANPKSHRRAA